MNLLVDAGKYIIGGLALGIVWALVSIYFRAHRGKSDRELLEEILKELHSLRDDLRNRR